jgi:hypothetical protein
LGHAKTLLYNDLRAIAGSSIVSIDLAGLYHVDQQELLSQSFRILADGCAHLQRLNLDGFFLLPEDIQYWMDHSQAKLLELSLVGAFDLRCSPKYFIAWLKHHKDTLESISLTIALLLPSEPDEESVFVHLQKLRSVAFKTDLGRYENTMSKECEVLNGLFTHCPRNLEHFSLDQAELGWKPIPESCLQFLSTANNLTTFRLPPLSGNSTKYYNVLWKAVSQLPLLSDVLLMPVGSKRPQLLANEFCFPSLTNFAVSTSFEDWDGAGFDKLCKNLAPKLQKLQISEMDLQEERVKRFISCCNALDSLYLMEVNGLSTHWVHTYLAPLAPTLTTLYLHTKTHPKVSEDAVSNLSVLHNLEVLELFFHKGDVATTIPYALASSLPRLRRFRTIDLPMRKEMMEIQDPSLFAIARMPQLEAIHGTDFDFTSHPLWSRK